ncbi:snoRNA-binding rRNA-processing protein [Perkinsus olseni]|uniref:SnoRNA-binding rRNA-processing protein n=1 Tax=Perkinsus olseni TaxID=32597 RepID=A0A7J6SV83_PEROL|nr:snoRNA-binding rRNA-processing protein [Perkinsus olseni]
MVTHAAVVVVWLANCILASASSGGSLLRKLQGRSIRRTINASELEYRPWKAGDMRSGNVLPPVESGRRFVAVDPKAEKGHVRLIRKASSGDCFPEVPSLSFQEVLGVVESELGDPNRPGLLEDGTLIRIPFVRVHSRFQNRGIASKMLPKALEDVWPNVVAAYLEVEPTNQVAMKLYTKAGFTLVPRKSVVACRFIVELIIDGGGQILYKHHLDRLSIKYAAEKAAAALLADVDLCFMPVDPGDGLMREELGKIGGELPLDDDVWNCMATPPPIDSWAKFTIPVRIVETLEGAVSSANAVADQKIGAGKQLLIKSKLADGASDGTSAQGETVDPRVVHLDVPQVEQDDEDDRYRELKEREAKQKAADEEVPSDVMKTGEGTAVQGHAMESR